MVKQTCYIATVERRKAIDMKNKTILVEITLNGKKHIERGQQFIKYERLLMKDYDSKEVYKNDDGRMQYIEYIKDGKVIIFGEYLYDCYHHEAKVDIRKQLTWEGE